MKHKYSKILTKDFLIKEYVNKKKFPKLIAKQLKCSISIIWRYIKKYNIPIRPLSEVKLGKNNSFYGCRHSEKTKKKISRKIQGKNNGNYGGKWHGERVIPDWKGKKNPKYIDGRTSLINRIYNSNKYKKWRISIYERDNYTCQECNQYGGQLEVHHKKGFVKIFKTFLQEYNNYSIIKDEEILLVLAMDFQLFWDINNGITLCKDCHLKRHPKKRSKNGRFQTVLV